MRVLAGYWTHGGYLNWDTGFGFRRWHQSKKLGLSQQALIGIATAPELAPHPSAPAWAKWMLDRGFEFYERQLARNGDEPPGLFFGVHKLPQDAVSARLALARMTLQRGARDRGRARLARAEGAAAAVLVRPRHGRLAVRHADYNTAIVPSSRGAYPYGGIDLARLYDGRQEVAAGSAGGRPPRSGCSCATSPAGASSRPSSRTAAGCGSRRRRTASARERLGVDRPRVRRPVPGPARGRDRARRRLDRAHEPPLHRVLRADDLVAAADRRPRGRATADVLFPSWGRGARVTAVMRDGSTPPGRRRADPARAVAHLLVERATARLRRAARGRARAGATVHLLHPRPQSSAPLAGPTLAVQLVRKRRVRTARFSARYAPVERERAAETAARMAR